MLNTESKGVPMRLIKPQSELSALPILLLWPHSKCNCKCVMCDIWKIPGRQEIAVDRLKEWVEDWNRLKVRSILLTGGEALMHSHIAEFCRVLKEAGFRIAILSTGLTLHQHVDLVVSHFEAVYVSLDGPQRIHDFVRRIPNSYERMAAGILALKSVRPDFPVRARCTVQYSNFQHLRATVCAAHDLRIDALGFSPADVTSQAFNRPEPWDSHRGEMVTIREGDLDLLQCELDAMELECSADFASGFIIDSPASLRRRILDYYRALSGRAEFASLVCNAPWVSAVLEYDGTVRPCYFQQAYGKVSDGVSLSSIVNSPSAVAFRQNLDVSSDAICRKCVCPMAIFECNCEWTTTPPYCDSTCMLVNELLNEPGTVYSQVD